MFGRAGKSGVLPKAIDSVFEEICSLSELKLRGLMAVGPLTDNEKTIHGAFKLLKDNSTNWPRPATESISIFYRWE
jgi:uncharacterized pyridoxal phosphate-containing UPF0001 family protein